MPSLKIHRPRVFTPSHSKAETIATNKFGLVAKSSENGNIELFKFSPEFPEKPQFSGEMFTDMESEASALCFVSKNRLVSAGLGGVLSLWNTNSFQEMFTENMTVAVWQLEACPTDESLFAAACDDTIRLYKFHEKTEQLELVRVFPSLASGRVISLDWMKDGLGLVSGSIGCFTVWRIEKTGASIIPYEIRTVKVSVSNIKDSKIWKIKNLDNRIVVTGDSSNRIMFWDILTGTTVSEFKLHEAPIISIAVSPDCKTVYCSGSDSRIFEFNFSNRVKNWTQGATFYTTTPYDITSFCKIEGSEKPGEFNLLATRSNGSMDSFLVKNNNIQASKESKLYPQKSSFVQIQKNDEGNDQIFTKDLHQLDLYQLDMDSVEEHRDETPKKSKHGIKGVKNGRIQVLKKNQLEKGCSKIFSFKSNDKLHDACFSNNFLACATKKYVKLYKFEQDTGFSEVFKSQIFSKVTCLSVDEDQVLAGFGDGSIVSYKSDAESGISETSEISETVIKRKSSTNIPKSILQIKSSLIYSTFANDLFKLDLSNLEKKVEELPSNQECIEYLEKSDSHKKSIIVGTSGNMFLIKLRNGNIEQKTEAKSGEHTKFYDFGDFHVTNDLLYVQGGFKLGKQLFPKRTNLSSEIAGAKLVGDGNLVVVDRTNYALLENGPQTLPAKRRKYGR